MKPKDVNPRNYDCKSIIYESELFSISYGIFDSDNEVLAMRWNGSNNDPGYPKVFGHPMWFIIPEELFNTFIIPLLNHKNSNPKEILNILHDRITTHNPQ